MQTKLTILGCGTHIPEVNKSNPAYILDIEDNTVLLDIGSGTLRQIVKTGRSLWEIDKIFLSHLHIDHIIDLIPLFFTYKYQQNIQINSKQIPIFAHIEFEERIIQLQKIYGNWINSGIRPFFHKKLKPGIFQIDNWKLSVFLPNHASHSLIYRYEDSNGKTFVYSGDTGPSEGLLRAAEGADLLLVEGSCRDEFPIDGHMTPKELNRLIKIAKPKKVVVTHIFPDNDDGSLIERIGFINNSEIIIAKDFMEIIF